MTAERSARPHVAETTPMPTPPSPGSETTPTTRVASLDVLRAAATFLVLGRHALFLANYQMGRVPEWLRGVLGPWYRGGWVGVDIFFVLSGFLVTGLLFREFKAAGRLAVGRFLVRRGFKIYPAYYAMMGVAAVVVAVTLPGPFPWWRFVRECVFVQNYYPSIWDHTWSLAVEEHFYLLLPAVLVAMRTVRPNAADPFRPILAVYLVTMLVTLAWRGVIVAGLPSTPSAFVVNTTVVFPTHLRIDSLLLGSALAYLFHFRRAWVDRQLRGRAGWFLAAGGLLLAPVFVFDSDTRPVLYTAGPPVFALGAACLIAGLLARDLPCNVAVRGLAFLGRHSYSIYLWHLAVAAWFVPWLQTLTGPLAMDTKILAYLVLAPAVGVALGYAIERPFLWLRERVAPPRPVPPDGAHR